MTSIALGFIVSPICYIFVAFVKGKVGYDDSLDVFGVHCIGGIVGAIGTGIVAAPSLGGQGVVDSTVFPAEIGSASGRERVCQYGKITVGTVALNTKNNTHEQTTH